MAHPALPRMADRSFRTLVRRSVANPAEFLATAAALVKGHLYLGWYRLLGRRVRAGRSLKVFGTLWVRGPGEVVFGDRVTILGNTTPFTYSPDARITIGDGVLMGSARFGCARAITIGDECILADCSIADTDHHSAQANRRLPDTPVRIAPVTIGRNVWIAQNAAILPGCSIGENSVVAHGAVVMRSFGSNIVIVGNPAKVASPIPSGEPDAAGPPGGPQPPDRMPT